MLRTIHQWNHLCLFFFLFMEVISNKFKLFNRHRPIQLIYSSLCELWFNYVFLQEINLIKFGGMGVCTEFLSQPCKPMGSVVMSPLSLLMLTVCVFSIFSWITRGLSISWTFSKPIFWSYCFSLLISCCQPALISALIVIIYLFLLALGFSCSFLSSFPRWKLRLLTSHLCSFLKSVLPSTLAGGVGGWGRPDPSFSAGFWHCLMLPSGTTNVTEISRNTGEFSHSHSVLK